MNIENLSNNKGQVYLKENNIKSKSNFTHKLQGIHIIGKRKAYE